VLQLVVAAVGAAALEAVAPLQGLFTREGAMPRGLLVLGRKCGEKVNVFCGGESVEITVEQIRNTRWGLQVHLSFLCPPSVHILRSELLNRNKPEQEETRG
jgi:sRNA-binding carbon storage regulator CsrA